MHIRHDHKTKPFDSPSMCRLKSLENVFLKLFNYNLNYIKI